MSLLSTATLFELYAAEKADMEDVLEGFPSFKIWKAQMLLDRQAEMDATEIPVGLEIVTFDVSIEDTSVDKTKVPSIINDVKAINKPKQKEKTNVKQISNMDRARKIFAELIGQNNELPPRKEVIARFIDQLGISPNCASTYAHNIRQPYLT